MGRARNLGGEVNARRFTVVKGSDNLLVRRKKYLGVFILVGLKRCMQRQLPDIGQGFGIEIDFRTGHSAVDGG